MTPEFTRDVVARVTNRTPYRVAWGIGECNESYHATWEEALTFARRMRDVLNQQRNPYNSISIYNDDLADSGDDSANVTGLTDEQEAEWAE